MSLDTDILIARLQEMAHLGLVAGDGGLDVLGEGTGHGDDAPTRTGLP